LDQKKGIDVLSAPKVTTKSGQRSEIRIVRKFFYPTVFDPPTIPDGTDTGTTTGGGIGNPIFRTPPTVTPAFPSNFEERDIGVILNVLPTIGPDTYTIDLSLTPEVVDFDGFINYGSPINTVGYAFNALEGTYTPQAIALTENVINQPVFSVRRVETEVTIWDGQTVALGGLMREDVQKVQDKVPIIGDIPLAGRLFRSNVDQKIKRNLIIFVSANIIDAEGRPLRRDDEVEDDIVEPLGLPEQLAGPQFPTFKGGGIRMK
jgi:general secretion pathway protein D